MPLSQNAVPTNVPSWVHPLDEALAFATAQTLTASGYVNQKQTQIDIGPGRWIGNVILDLTTMKVSAGDETYRLMLLGSNDAAFGNGNVELLGIQDFAAASAGRLLPTVSPPSDAVPTPGRSGSRFIMPATNQRGIYVFRYLQLYLQAGGTAPSISLAAWLSILDV